MEAIANEEWRMQSVKEVVRLIASKAGRKKGGCRYIDIEIEKRRKNVMGGGGGAPQQSASNRLITDARQRAIEKRQHFCAPLYSIHQNQSALRTVRFAAPQPVGAAFHLHKNKERERAKVASDGEAEEEEEVDFDQARENSSDSKGRAKRKKKGPAHSSMESVTAAEEKGGKGEAKG